MAIKPLLLTWIALMLLLAATVASILLPIGEWRQLVNLAIAACKAALILWIFMKLREEASLVRLMFATAAVLLTILATILAADYFLRPGPI